MIVTHERLGDCVRFRAPQFNAEIRGARCEERTVPVERDAIDRIDVALECSLELTRFVVPYFYRRVLSRARENGKIGMKADARHDAAMTPHAMLRRCCRHKVVLDLCIFCFRTVHVHILFQSLILALELHYLPLQTHDRGPFLYQHAPLRRRRGFLLQILLAQSSFSLERFERLLEPISVVLRSKVQCNRLVPVIYSHRSYVRHRRVRRARARVISKLDGLDDELRTMLVIVVQ